MFWVWFAAVPPRAREGLVIRAIILDLSLGPRVRYGWMVIHDLCFNCIRHVYGYYTFKWYEHARNYMLVLLFYWLFIFLINIWWNEDHNDILVSCPYLHISIIISMFLFCNTYIMKHGPKCLKGTFAHVRKGIQLRASLSLSPSQSASLTEPLASPQGTPGCRGTLAGKRWPRVLVPIPLGRVRDHLQGTGDRDDGDPLLASPQLTALLYFDSL